VTSLTVYVSRDRGQKQDFLKTALNLHVDYLSSCLLALFLACMAVLCQANAVWAQEVVASCYSSSLASSHWICLCLWLTLNIATKKQAYPLLYLLRLQFYLVRISVEVPCLLFFSPCRYMSDSFPSGHYHISGHNHAVTSRRRDLTCTNGIACKINIKKNNILVVFNIGPHEVGTVTYKMLIKVIITIMFR